MKINIGWQWCFFGIVTIGLAAIAIAPPSIMAQPELSQLPFPSTAPEQQEGVETLTQGPIHEAFANPADLDPTPGPVVTMQPPEDIAEEPPEFMPEDSVWITGYWIWDDERDDFVWVTGVARKIPPGMRYVPGYWIEAGTGFQRVSGFWTSDQTQELEYREPPPETLEAGPSSPAPAEDHFWVPGNWNYYDTGYRWRAGYWSPYQSDWVWCPARWSWTPAGCVYLSGYWDYRLSYRGTMFAPVYFTQPIYRQPNWVYRPWCSIPTNNLFIHLWVRPNYCHYYFGNYYGPRYAGRGFNAWCNYPTRRYHYDPFFTYCNVHYRRQGVDFVGRVRGWHDHYDRHEDRRPPRTWREQQQFFAQRDNRTTVETQLVARNIVDVARRDDTPLRLAKVDDVKRQAIAERTARSRELHTARKQIERENRIAVQLPRDRDGRPGRDNEDRPGRDNDDRGSKGAKGGDRDDLTGKSDGKTKGDDVADGAGKGRDRDGSPDLPGKGKVGDREDLPGKGKADDLPGKGKGADPVVADGKADRGDKTERGDTTDRGEKGDKTGDRPAGAARVPGGVAGGQSSGKGRGVPPAKLKLPQDPDVATRGGPGRPTGDDGDKAGGKTDGKTGGKAGPGRRDNIPPPMPTAGVDQRPGRDAVDRPGAKGGPTSDRPGGEKGKSGRPEVERPKLDRPGVDRPGVDRPGQDERGDKGAPPRPRLPGVDLPGDAPSGPRPKGGAPKLDLPQRDNTPGRPGRADAPRIDPSDRPGDRPGGFPKGSQGGLPKADSSPTLPKASAPSAAPKLDPPPRIATPRSQSPSPSRPSFEAPKADRPRGESRPQVEPRRVETPNLDRPRPQPRADAPRPEPRVEGSRPAPRVEARPAPRVEAPRPVPRIDTPRPTPRVETPQPAPRNETPRAAPRLEAPRPEPRREAPRPEPRREAPRVEAPRNISPRVSAPPRIEAPRPAPQRPSTPRVSAPRPSSPPRVERPSGGNPGSSESRNRGKSRDQD